MYKVSSVGPVVKADGSKVYKVVVEDDAGNLVGTLDEITPQAADELAEQVAKGLRELARQEGYV